jgi:chemotaxis protein CheX
LATPGSGVAEIDAKGRQAFMDVRYINPFLKAVTNLFATMIELPLTVGKPRLKEHSEPSFEISGIIGLSGTVTGCVVISISEEIALQLASSLFGEDFTEVDDDCIDAIGEIANMIAGNAKTDFPGDESSISVPSVIIGKHKVAYPRGIPIVSIPCKTDSGTMVIDVALKIPE